MTNLDSIKKSLKLDNDTLTRYEFSQKLEQLENSDRKLNQIIVEVVSMLAEAKKELTATDMETVNELIDEVKAQSIDTEKLSFQQLKSYCVLKGVDAKGKSKEQLLKELAQI
ncbi:MAG: hypothetical protein RLZZ535_3512 [Cyanobacteriota bacterium]